MLFDLATLARNLSFKYHNQWVAAHLPSGKMELEPEELWQLRCGKVR
jgi:hypothetical protein